MIIDTCLLASNLNKNYYQFYPLCRLVWKELCGISTRLALIGDHIPEYLAPYTDEIILIPPFNGLNDVFLAQAIREYYPCIMNDCKGIIMSDIDMLPMSRSYFIDTVKDIPQDQFVIYRDQVLNGIQEIPMCYCAGSPQAFRNLFKCETMEDIKRELTKVAEGHTFDSQHGGQGWIVDQLNLYKTVTEHQPQDQISRITDEETGFTRLDRIDNYHSVMLKASQQCPQLNAQVLYNIARAYET